MYRLSGVTKEYDHGQVVALRGVNLVLDDGDWLAVRGPTGHGKSTLLQLLGGLDRPTRGTVELDGEDLGRMSERAAARVRAASIGFVFQSFNLIPTLSAAENVEAALVPLGVAGAQRRRCGSSASGARAAQLPGRPRRAGTAAATRRGRAGQARTAAGAAADRAGAA